MRKHVFPALLGLSLLGCLAPGPNEDGGGAVSGVGLYAYDNAGKRVLVWKDLGALYDDPATPAASAVLTSNLFDAATPLAWNGLAFDPSRNQLYLVGESGDVVRVNRARAQTGTIPSTDIVSFKLDAGNRLSNGKFGQAAMDASSNTLYVTENGDNGTRIWAVSSANARVQGESVALSAVQVSTGSGSGDSGGYGVAASAGAIYGSFKNGNPVGIDNLTGPRIRKGAGSAFPSDTQVLVGSNTLLGEFAPLGLDAGNGILYAGVHLSTAGVTGGSPVLAFKVTKLAGSPNQAPDALLGDPSTLDNLRFLAHGGSKDWLVAGPDTGTALWIWKQPSAGGSQFKSKAPAGSAVFRAVAMDGNG